MSKLNVQIITPLGVSYQAEASEIIVPTSSGVITVLPQHIPLISTIKSGELLVRDAQGEQSFAVYSGVIEVHRMENDISRVVVLANRSEKADEIDLERAERALARAKEAMNETDNSLGEYSRIEALIEKELNRVRVASKRKNSF